VSARRRGATRSLSAAAGEFGRHACRFPVILYLFADTPKEDPIAGMAHHFVAPCPASDSHQVSGPPFESQKLVESGTLHLRNGFRDSYNAGEVADAAIRLRHGSDNAGNTLLQGEVAFEIWPTFSLDGSLLACAFATLEVHSFQVWDTNSRQRSTLTTDYGPDSVAFSPRNEYVALARQEVIDILRPQRCPRTRSHSSHADTAKGLRLRE